MGKMQVYTCMLQLSAATCCNAMRLIRFVLQNNLLVNLLTVLALLLGGLRMTTIQREAFPSVNFDVVAVSTPYPGASPREVEQYVTHLLETEIDRVDGIDEFHSVSLEGLSLITIKLDPDRSEADKDKTVTDIQRAVDRARDLPNDLPNPPLVRSIESENFPVVDISLNGDLPYADLHAYADRLQAALEKLPDVAKVDWKAKREKEYWVEVDPAKLRRYDLGLMAVIGTLRARNINLPGGAISTPGGEILVRTIGETRDAADLHSVVLRTNDAGYVVRLGDVARVRETFAEKNRANRTDGRPSILLSVIIDAEKGDILRMVDQAKALTETFIADLDDTRLNFAFVNDMSYFVRNRLGVLVNNGIAGIFLVLAVLLISLSKGIAFVTAAGIPVAFLGTILAMDFTGLSINLLTMFALIIVLGMVVDDAIIVGENIWQHYEGGKSPFDAVVDGTTEVIWPVTATILTSIAAFSPLLFVSGVFGKFMYALPVVVMIALGVSLLEAMLILPSHAFDVLKWGESWRQRRGKPRPTLHEDDVGSGGILRGLLNGYAWLLARVLRWRYGFVAGVVALFAFSLYVANTRMSTIIFPSSGIEIFFIRATLPPGTPIEATERAFLPLERLVATLPASELNNHITQLGLQQNDPNMDPFTKRGSHLGQILVFLSPELDRERSAEDIVESLRADVAAIAKREGYADWGFDRMRPGPPVGKPVAIRVMGDDLDNLQNVAKAVLDKLEKQLGVQDAAIDFTPGKDEMRVVVNDIAAKQSLLTVDMISRHIMAAFEGHIASHIRAEGERIPIRIRLDEKSRDDLKTLLELKIPNERGVLVPLRDVAAFERTPGILQITRRNGSRVVTVTANLDERQTSSTVVNRNLEPILRQIESEHQGVTLSAGGEFEETTESMESLAHAFVFALGSIFLILAAQFRSLTQPFVVMSAIPFGFIGVIWAFYAMDLPLSFLGFVGMIGLSGVVVNDSIVLVSFINSAMANGKSAFEAALHAGRRRFRAVWLTTLTTVFGLLPMVYGIGGMDKFLQPAGVALGYGLLFGTVIVLLFVPAMVLIREDFFSVLGWAWRQLAFKRQR